MSDRYIIRTTGQTGPVDTTAQTALAAHLADTSDAHDASAISYAGSANLSATDVEAALDELDTEKVSTTTFQAHLDDTADAHDASAISVLDTAGNWTATDVEGVLAEVPSRLTPGVFTVDSYLNSLYGVTAATATTAQTLAAFDAAMTAAAAVRGTVKFTPGLTYSIASTFKVKTGVVVDCTNAYLKKANGSNLAPLMVNEDWANGNPDITIIAHGSTWDFNGRQLSASGSPAYGQLGDCVHFQNCDRLRIIGRPKIIDATKFAITVGHCVDIQIDGAIFDTRSDGFHGYGPMKRAKFGVFTGTTGDDFFALTISDYASQIANLTANGETVTEGDFEDITVEALQINNAAVPTGGSTTGSGFALVGNSASYKFRRIKVGAITGITKKAVRITTDANLTSTNVEDITFDKIATNTPTGTVATCSISPTSGQNISIGEIISYNTGASYLLDLGGTIDVINVGRLTQTAGVTSYLVLVGTGASIGTVNISNVNCAFGANGRLVQHSSATATTRFNINNFDLRGSGGTRGWGCYVAATSPGIKLKWVNGTFRNVVWTGNFAGGTSQVWYDNVEVDTCTQFINIDASTTVRALFGAIRQVTSGDRTIAKNASGIYSCTGPMASTDIAKIDTSAAVAGDLIYNNNSGGAVGLGVAQWSGSAWALV